MNDSEVAQAVMQLSFAEWVSIGRDVIVSLAAIITVGLAVYGVWSWKREFHGKTTFDGASKLLHAAYRLGEAIQAFRSPVLAKWEFEEWYILIIDKQKEDPEIKARALREVYNKRFEKVNKAEQELKEIEIQVKTVLGTEEVTRITVHIFALSSTLLSALTGYIGNIESGYTEYHPERDKTQWRDVVETIDWSKDHLIPGERFPLNQFSEAIRTVMKMLEEDLQKYLK